MILQSTDTTAPWSYNWNTVPFADNQMHSILLKAYDAGNNVGTSIVTTVTVQP